MYIKCSYFNILKLLLVVIISSSVTCFAQGLQEVEGTRASSCIDINKECNEIIRFGLSNKGMENLLDYGLQNFGPMATQQVVNITKKNDNPLKEIALANNVTFNDLKINDFKLGKHSIKCSKKECIIKLPVDNLDLSAKLNIHKSGDKSSSYILPMDMTSKLKKTKDNKSPEIIFKAKLDNTGKLSKLVRVESEDLSIWLPQNSLDMNFEYDDNSWLSKKSWFGIFGSITNSLVSQAVKTEMVTNLILYYFKDKISSSISSQANSAIESLNMLKTLEGSGLPVDLPVYKVQNLLVEQEISDQLNMHIGDLDKEIEKSSSPTPELLKKLKKRNFLPIIRKSNISKFLDGSNKILDKISNHIDQYRGTFSQSSIEHLNKLTDKLSSLDSSLSNISNSSDNKRVKNKILKSLKKIKDMKYKVASLSQSVQKEQNELVSKYMLKASVKMASNMNLGISASLQELCNQNYKLDKNFIVDNRHDFSVETSIDLVNEYLRSMHKKGGFKLCSKVSVAVKKQQYKLCDKKSLGVKFDMGSAPSIQYDPIKGGHYLQINNLKVCPPKLCKVLRSKTTPRIYFDVKMCGDGNPCLNINDVNFVANNQRLEGDERAIVESMLKGVSTAMKAPSQFKKMVYNSIGKKVVDSKFSYQLPQFEISDIITSPGVFKFVGNIGKKNQ